MSSIMGFLPTADSPLGRSSEISFTIPSFARREILVVIVGGVRDMILAISIRETGAWRKRVWSIFDLFVSWTDTIFEPLRLIMAGTSCQQNPWTLSY
jgi:hypothetical protein